MREYPLDIRGLILHHLLPEIEYRWVAPFLWNDSLDLREHMMDENLVRKYEILLEVDSLGHGRIIPRAAGIAARQGRIGLARILMSTHLYNRQPEPETSVQFIIDGLRSSEETIELLAVGRMTNIAEVIRQAPEAASRIKRVVMMGGAVAVPGNVTEWAEANIFGDPEAAAFIFDSGVPVLMVGLDATLSHQMKKTTLLAMRDALGDAGEFLWDIKQCYLKFYAEKGMYEGFPIHDSTAALAMVYPECLDLKRGKLSCVVDGVERGRTLFIPDDKGEHTVALGAAGDQLSTLFEAAMQQQFGQ